MPYTLKTRSSYEDVLSTKWRLFLLLVMLISGVSMITQAQGRMQVTGTVRTDQGELLPNASGSS